VAWRVRATKFGDEVPEMKRKSNIAATIIAICLITTATHAQRSGGSLVLRFRAPFAFTVDNRMLAAGEYEVTQLSQFVLSVRNVENQTSAFEHVEPAGSKADGRARTVFHRYGEAYFLATISNGSWQSTYAFGRSNKEKELVRNTPTLQPEVVSVLSRPTAVSADVGRK
jgi:hypothetical protein